MKIVFLDEYSVGGTDISPIKSLGDYTGYDVTHRNQILERARGAEVLIVNKSILDANTLAALPDLRLICIAATGMNNIDLEAAAALGIEVRNAVGYSTYSVAETTIGSAIALLREVVYYDEYFKSGRYAAADYLFNYDRPTSQIRGKRWGIIGLGNIGREVARLAEAFGCTVSYYSTSGVARDEVYKSLELNDLLKSSDIVSIHCPLNDRTRNLIGKEELQSMKSSAIIINVARGGIIDEEALAEALDNGSIRGAALDVFSREPLRESPLYNIKDKYRLLASPHNAWSAEASLKRLIDCIVQNIKAYQAK
ncbi:MAG: D-2-hydroxyacid dehydrogenase [Alistipes sp.]|nr:D-2-hydroxyacid dehydrogenase [Alistipes sp.]